MYGSGLRGRSVALAVAVVVVIVAAVVPSIAAADTFFGPKGSLTPTEPAGGCKTDWTNWGQSHFGGSGFTGGCASTGYTTHQVVTLHKWTGDRVALGFQNPPTEGSNFLYATYGSAGNGNWYSQSNIELGADGYNKAFCAYYSGNNSQVDCVA